MAYFPMFVQLEGRPCLVVGGGRVALRKARALRDFGALVTVVADKILEDIKRMEGVVWREGHFCPADLKGQALVVAAMDDKEENHRVSVLCRERRIPVNAVDQIEDCGFIFPAYVKQGEVVAACSSGGQSPAVAQYLKGRIEPEMTETLGELAAQLGKARERVKRMEPAEVRKGVYEEILRRGLEFGRPLSREELEEILICPGGEEEMLACSGGEETEILTD